MSRVGEWAMESQKQIKTFEGYLRAMHMIENPTVLDDDLSGHFDNWISQLDFQEIIDHAETWHKIQTEEPF